MFIWRMELLAKFFLNFLAWLKSEAVVGLLYSLNIASGKFLLFTAF
jgi:hypothetical protein